MSFNPFAVESATEVTTDEVAVDVPTPPQPEVMETANNEAVTTIVDGKEVKLTKTGKVRKPRKENATITKEMKAEILKRYATENCATIATSMGLESRQVYNVVRNTRIKLEELRDQTSDPAVKANIETAIAKLPHKDFGGGASGPRANSLSNDDILATLLG